MKRQISDAEKKQVRLQQQDKDGSLRCFISGQVIGVTDEFEYDHILPFAKQGDSDLSNIRIVFKVDILLDSIPVIPAQMGPLIPVQMGPVGR